MTNDMKIIDHRRPWRPKTTSTVGYPSDSSGLFVLHTSLVYTSNATDATQRSPCVVFFWQNWR